MGDDAEVRGVDDALASDGEVDASLTREPTGGGSEGDLPDLDPAAQASEEGDAGASEADIEEFEITRETGEDAPRFTQSNVDDIVRRRVARLNKKTEDAASRLEQLEEQNRLLQMALEQKRDAGPPKPDDFEDGELDPAYIEAVDKHRQRRIEAEVDRRVKDSIEAERKRTTDAAKQSALLNSQREHYARAAKLKAKDYEATEDVAIEALGREAANHIIQNFNDSHALLYYLGKNPGEANRVAAMLQSNDPGGVIKGVAELGRLSAQIRVKPKSSKAPEPEPELEGAVATTRVRRKRGHTFE